MAKFALGHREDPSHGLRRVIAELCQTAIADLEELPPEEAVHILRTSIKKIRSIVKMTRARDRTKAKAISEYLQTVASLAAPSRDLYVKIRVLNKLKGGISRPLELELCNDLEKQLQVQLEILNAASIKVRLPSSLQIALGEVRKWSYSKLRQKNLKRAWKRAKAKTVKAGKTAADCPSIENFHHWRKRAKSLWYMTELIQGVIIPSKKKLICRLKKLSKHLGNAHDLALLEQSVEGIPSNAAKRVRNRILEKRRKLQKKSFRFVDL